MTAKEWRESNPNLNGNIRDYTDILHLVVLSNLEVLNASMIENNISQKDRLEKLNITAKRQINILTNDENIIGITKIASEIDIAKYIINDRITKNNIDECISEFERMISDKHDGNKYKFSYDELWDDAKEIYNILLNIKNN